jgi:very-short-patch-repair endonuclease
MTFKNKYKERELVCISCNAYVKKRMPENRKYCSLTCYRKSKKPQLLSGQNVNCTNCNAIVYKQRTFLTKSRNLFCSVECSNQYQGRNKIIYVCKICTKDFMWSKSRTKQSNPTYCSMSCRNQDKLKLIENSLKGNYANLQKNGLNKLEKKGNMILDELGLNYECQVTMYEKFIVDVLIKESNLIIQWDGEYWHNKPKRKALDASQDAYLSKCGYRVLRITDKQIKNNLKEVYDNITRAIQ